MENQKNKCDKCKEKDNCETYNFLKRRHNPKLYEIINRNCNQFKEINT